MRRSIALACLGLVLAPAALAQDLGSAFDEVRIGVAAHDVYGGFLPVNSSQWTIEAPEDVAFEVLFRSPDIEAFQWIGAPRPNIGGTVSTTGRESLLHAGLTWQVPVFETPLYLEATFGAAIHNGALTGATDPGRNLGCRVNFYEALGVGANLSDEWTLTVSYEHTSNANLCEENDGLSNLGVKLGYKF